jgi:hypothetical protein
MPKAADAVSFILDAQHDAYQGRVLSIWTIYEPKDYPDAYVARMFVTDGESEPVPTKVTLRSPDIEALRTAFIRAGLRKMARADSDEPQIGENWV